MIIGIIPNIYKTNIAQVIIKFAEKLKEKNIDFIICDNVSNMREELYSLNHNLELRNVDEIFRNSDIVVSIGGDGTMLNTAYLARDYNTPILGVNFGKLGFLAEVDINRMDTFLNEIKNGEYTIEERIVLEGEYAGIEKKLFAINDIVIDKGNWPKMIEISLRADEDYVTTFLADGIILATPTGSTGYSLSTGGPVVNPLADVITISPISPHSLTMRHLVLSSSQKIYITVKSLHSSINISCDGQRVFDMPSPLELMISRSNKKVRLVHTKSTNYFRILREKLFWGIDIRKNEY